MNSRWCCGKKYTTTILFFYTQFEISDKTGENVIHDFDISIGKII